MTDLGMQISLEAVYKSQMGDQDTVQLRDGFVQIDTVESCLHGPWHGTLQIFEAARHQGLIMGLQYRHVDKIVAFNDGSGNLQGFEGTVDAYRFFDEFTLFEVNQAESITDG